MAKATWNGAVIAESDAVEIVEGNVYFPPQAVRRDYLKDSDTHTTCPWKGIASYYHVEVDGRTNRDAAWYYPEAKEAARNNPANRSTHHHQYAGGYRFAQPTLRLRLRRPSVRAARPSGASTASLRTAVRNAG